MMLENLKSNGLELGELKVISTGKGRSMYNEVLKIAQFNHEVNRLYCQLFMNDFSQPTWDEAPDWQKESAFNGVEFHLVSNRTPQESHESWMKQKVEDGWKYGEVKDPEKKEHPCMVPYDDLPEEQKIKDSLFTMSVEALKPLLLR